MYYPRWASLCEIFRRAKAISTEPKFTSLELRISLPRVLQMLRCSGLPEPMTIQGFSSLGFGLGVPSALNPRVYGVRRPGFKSIYLYGLLQYKAEWTGEAGGGGVETMCVI